MSNRPNHRHRRRQISSSRDTRRTQPVKVADPRPVCTSIAAEAELPDFVVQDFIEATEVVLIGLADCQLDLPLADIAWGVCDLLFFEHDDPGLCFACDNKHTDRISVMPSPGVVLRSDGTTSCYVYLWLPCGRCLDLLTSGRRDDRNKWDLGISATVARVQSMTDAAISGAVAGEPAYSPPKGTEPAGTFAVYRL
jgi:hypothetical protein